MKPEILLNKLPNTVAKEINSYLAYLHQSLKTPPHLCIASGYFNLGGYELLADELEKVSTFKLLLGAEPREPENQSRILQNFLNISSGEGVEEALNNQEETIFHDRNLLGFDLQTDSLAQRLIKWLNSENVEVRRLKKYLLHGKAYLISHSDKNDEGVIVGSSNFTRAGLSKNIELNIANYQPSLTHKVQEWFDELWNEAQDFDLASYYSARYEEYQPYFIFLRMLWEYYQHEIRDDDLPSGITLAEFQEHGLARARRILEERNGVLIADEVGLGKTYIAGALLEETIRVKRQRALIIAPATLRDSTWDNFVSDNELYCEILSYEQLAKDEQLAQGEQNTKRHLKVDVDHYSLIVVDEAHNLRNRKTNKAEALRGLLKGTPPKKIALLTATPVNNTLEDLQNLLEYFLKDDAALRDKGIFSIAEKFKEAEEREPDALSPKLLYHLLDAVAVRRTRSFIKKNYPNAQLPGPDGELENIIFPDAKLLPIDYNLDDVLPLGFFEDFAQKLATTEEGRGADYLTLARYTPSKYRKQKEQEIQHREVNIAGLMRIALLKRLESSTNAFANTCEKFIVGIENMLNFINQGVVPIGSTMRDWIATDSDDLDDYLQELGGDQVEPIDKYDKENLKSDLKKDRHILEDFHKKVRDIKPKDDPKLIKLTEELAKIAASAKDGTSVDEDIQDKRKVIIFSFYADTAKWIHEFLKKSLDTHPDLESYRGRLAPYVSGQDNENTKGKIIRKFSPKTNAYSEQNITDEYDILVTTDVLAEGLNLQQARHIINYDLPWNPMRLVQRQGRIDRLRSSHKEIFLRCIYPDKKLDELLKLKERLEKKISLAAATIGTPEVLPGSQKADIDIADVVRGKNIDFLKDGGKRVDIMGAEEYRWILRDALRNDPGLADKLRELPWGIGSGMIATIQDQPGFIFCAKVLRHSEPHFRFIPWSRVDEKFLDTEDESESIVSEPFFCLNSVNLVEQKDTKRVLRSDMQNLTYEAWKVARENIRNVWNENNDPQNTDKRINSIVRDAVDCIGQYDGNNLNSTRIEEMQEAYNRVLNKEIVTEIRKILKNDNLTKNEMIEKLDRLAQSETLEPSIHTPEPDIELEDINLIAWLAIAPN